MRVTAIDAGRGGISASEPVKTGLSLMGQDPPGMKEFVAVSAEWPNRLKSDGPIEVIAPALMGLDGASVSSWQAQISAFAIGFA